MRRREAQPGATTLDSRELLRSADPVSEPGEWVLCFVIVFHPDTQRIGERSRGAATTPAILGRQAPRFAHIDSGPERGLNDPCVSRQAFRLRPVGDDWVLDRGAGRSRLQLDAAEVVDEVRLSRARLCTGILLTLAHRVVLHCRLQERGDGALPLPSSYNLLGVSPAMCQLHSEIRRVAATADDVLLVGATGTGKECVARAIHALAAPATAPWVAVNMAAIPTELAAASLFGARRGAYTGADSHRQGYFQRAMGGTLFLDEVGDTPEVLQPLLLRALQEREVQVVGGATQAVDLRVISATERDPAADATRFRLSLRQRLAAQEVELQPLRRRVEDIGLLVADRLDELALERGSPWRLDAGDDLLIQRWVRCFELLCRYPWPGNVRELRHAAAQLYAGAAAGPRFPPALRKRLLAAGSEAPVDAGDAGAPAPGETEAPDPGDTTDAVRETRPAPRKLAELSDEEFVAAWAAARYEVAALARRLGVSRAAIYRRLSLTEGCRLASDIPVGELLEVLGECRGDLRRSAERLFVSSRGLESRLRSSGLWPADLERPGASPRAD